MTRYSFLVEMQDLCNRVAVAFKTVKKSDVLLPKVYFAASEGFHAKSERISAAKADEELPIALYKRLKDFRIWVEKVELEANKEIC